MKRLISFFVFFLFVANIFAQDTGYIPFGTSNATGGASLSSYNLANAYLFSGSVAISYPQTGDVPYVKFRKTSAVQNIPVQTQLKIRAACPSSSLKMKMGIGFFNSTGIEGTSGLVELSNNGIVTDYPVNVFSAAPFSADQLKISFSQAPAQAAGNFSVYILGIWRVDNGIETQIDIPGGGGVVTVPGVPTLGIPVDGTTITTFPYQFNWGSVSGATSYTFQLDADQNFSAPITVDQTVTTTSYTVSNLPVGTYYWRVKANNSAGSSAFASPRVVNVGTGTTTQDPPIITSPTNGAMNVPQSGQQVIFTLPQQSAGCKLELREKVSGELIKNEMIQSPFVLNNLKPLTQYSLKLGAVYTNTIIWTAEYLFTTIGDQVITIPTPLSPSNGSLGTAIPVGLVASSVQNAVSYEFQVSRTQDFSVLDYTATQPTSYVNIHVLYWNNIYYWRVRAVTTTGTSGWSMVWSFTTGSMTDVDDKNVLPVKFGLMQNYPNPFNPTTSIKYDVSSIQYINITAYDILGREVAVLVNEQKTPGRYEVQFDGSKLSSGIYIYKFQAGNFSATKKMILMK